MTEVSNPPAAKTPSATGTYSGNSAANRAIPHGLGVVPSLVIILGTNVDYLIAFIDSTGQIIFTLAAGQGTRSVTAPTATNIYVGDAADYVSSGNSSTTSRTYRWIAFR